MAVLAEGKISKKFRITIPKEVREFLKITGEGTLIFFSMDDMKGRVCIRSG